MMPELISGGTRDMTYSWDIGTGDKRLDQALVGVLGG